MKTHLTKEFSSKHEMLRAEDIAVAMDYVLTQPAPVTLSVCKFDRFCT